MPTATTDGNRPVDPAAIDRERRIIETYACMPHAYDRVNVLHRIEAFAVARLIMHMRATTAKPVPEEDWVDVMSRATMCSREVALGWVRAAQAVVSAT